MIQRHDKKTEHFNIFLIFTIISIFLTGRSWAQTKDQSFPGLFEFDQYERQIVAVVGNKNISAKEFQLNYEFGPAFLKRSKSSKERYLKLMIYEKLLAIEGYNAGLDRKDNVIRSCTAYSDDIMTEELFKEEVMNQVKVSNTEIEKAVPLENIKVSLRWLYSEDKNDIFKLRELLNSGSSFDSLYSLQLNNEVTESDRSLNSSFFRLQMKNPQLASVVDKLTPGEYSKPIHVDDGWYIVGIENIWTNVLTTEMEINKVRHELERSIFKQKLDIASDIYIQDLMNAQNPEIDQNVFSRVVYYLNKEFLYPKSYQPDILQKLLPQASNDTNLDINNYTDQILVRSKSYQIQLQDFIDWYRPRMAYLKFSSKSAENFILSVQQTVWRMIRDYFLVQKAKSLELHKSKGVKIQTEWWQDKIVYNAMKSEIAMSIVFNDDDLLDYYHSNLKNYLDSDNKPIAFDKAKRNVQSDYIREKYMDKMMRQVLNLTQKYKIEINDSVLQNIKVEDEENPKLIDMFIVKKGGLLPRQPYPTIDWEWQQWY
jgi:hypothetical protein